jgi:glutaminase
MRTPLDSDDESGPTFVSTGHLPPAERVDTLLAEAHERFRSVDEGKVADYIPALARTPRELFGLCVVETSGAIHAAGNTDYQFSIQSISKPFVFALVCQAIGAEPARRRIGVNSTGLPFNSVMAIELNAERTMNPMVNAGAIATTSLAPGATADEKWAFVQDGLSRFAGHPLELDEEVYRSEAATNFRNRGIAKLLEGYGRMYCDATPTASMMTSGRPRSGFSRKLRKKTSADRISRLAV